MQQGCQQQEPTEATQAPFNLPERSRNPRPSGRGGCQTYNYPAEVERDEDGRYVVAFPDFGWGATDGATLDEALAEARDLLRELIAATMREGEGLPKPSRATRRRPLVVPPVPIALKAALYEAFRKAGMSQRRLARDLDIAESEVRRMLNPDHG